jgi:hypothetical protein
MNHALNLEEWSLSTTAIAFLEQEPEIAADLAVERQKLSFPAGYTPTVVDILFDDVLFVRSDRGQLVFLRECPANYQPPFVEVRFDDQTALFLIQGEIIVDRTQAMVSLDVLLGRLEPVSAAISLSN